MASSRVMASTSPAATSDLVRQPSSASSSIFSPSIPDLHSPSASTLAAAAAGVGSMTMDDILRNIYGENAAAAAPYAAAAEEAAAGELPPGRTVEEVWRDITAGRRPEGAGEMTLEDFLAKAGAVREEEVRVPSGAVQGGFGVKAVMGDCFAQQQQQQQQQQMALEGSVLRFGNGVESRGGGGGRGGRGRKRPVLDPVDRAALQRQKRMIKNRESAARSRERKQAYTAELESLVAQLEEENAQLLRYQEEMHRERLQQLMKNRIPVTKQKAPRRPLRRTCSAEW